MDKCKEKAEGRNGRTAEGQNGGTAEGRNGRTEKSRLTRYVMFSFETHPLPLS